MLSLAKDGEIPQGSGLKAIEMICEEFRKENQVCTDEVMEVLYNFNQEILEDFKEELDFDTDLILKNVDSKLKLAPYTSIYDNSKLGLDRDKYLSAKRHLYINNFFDGDSSIPNIPLFNPARRFLLTYIRKQNLENHKIVSKTTNSAKKVEKEPVSAKTTGKETHKNEDFKQVKHLDVSPQSNNYQSKPVEVKVPSDPSNTKTPDNKNSRGRNWDKYVINEKSGGFKSGLEYFQNQIKEGNAKPVPDIDLTKANVTNYSNLASNPSSLPKYDLGNYNNYKAQKGGKADAIAVDPKYAPLVTGDVTPEIISMVLDMKISECQKVSKDDIVGLEDVKKVIIDKVVNPILMPSLHIGLFKAPKGILLFGPPGTGKTTIAKWIANVSNASFFEISPSSITSKFYGESESIIKTLFKVALVESPSLIFIDEVDAILGKRKATDDECTVRMKNQLLQMMDGINSGSMSHDKESGEERMLIVVGATNRPHMMDSAALRRFTKRILIPPPDHNTRKKFIVDIINKRSSRSCIFSDEDLERISKATDGWTGSDLLTLCYKAAEYCYDDTVELFGGIENIKSFKDFRGVEMKDIERALQSTRPSTDEGLEFFLEWSRKHGSV